MNKIKAIGLGLGASMLIPFLSYAQFSTSTAITTVTTSITDVALIIAGVIAAILGLWAALTGLGWGMRKFKHYVSGRKF